MRPKLFKTPKKRDRKAEALTRLRERWEKENPDEPFEPEKEPNVTIMFRYVDGGMESVINALRTHDDDDARAFLEVYDGLNTTDARLVPVEAVAHVAGIGSLRLAEIAQTALYLYCSAQTKFLISSSMVKVTKSIVKAATDEVPITAYNSSTGMQEVVGKTNGDVKAMELFGRISGIAPVPKGATIAIQNNYGGEKEEEKPSLGWKTAEDRLREIQDATEPKRLPSPVAPPINIGGHIDHMQAQTVEILRER
jgi:hypothetical protein